MEMEPLPAGKGGSQWGYGAPRIRSPRSLPGHLCEEQGWHVALNRI